MILIESLEETAETLDPGPLIRKKKSCLQIVEMTCLCLARTLQETYHKLAERFIGRTMTKEEFYGCCKDNVNIGVLNPVIYAIKKRYDLLKKPINFAKLPSDVREEAELLLEEKAAPFLPLAACTGRWGEKMLLMGMWHRASILY
ncbi:hypothetical protein EDC94DRAFT_586666 [Helicostylum pulchrum]|nr:hypothetical protein EDC94DRAFT_586666 [Helicostylum pulchrum]